MSSHQRGAKCCHWAWEGAPGTETGAPETPGRVRPHSLLLESITGRRASQALAFFTGSGPFSLEVMSFTGIGLLHRLRDFLLEVMSFTGIGLLHRLRAFLLEVMSFTGIRLLHRLWA